MAAGDRETDQGGLLSPLLAISALVRIALVLSGGQDYWPDEDAANPRQIFAALARHDWHEVFIRFDSADHPLFRLIALAPAAVERLVWSDERVYALFVAAFSVINIWLLARIARRLGAGELESTAAGACLALSCAFFYWGRHVQPYDASITCALAALYVGVDPNRESVRRLYLCGLMCGCSFLTYAGSWALITGVAVTSVIGAGTGFRDLARGLIAAGLGGVTAVGAALAASAALGGQLADGLLTRAGSVTQGSFAEGWRLPFEYLWYAEHALLLAWLASAAWFIAQPRRLAASPRARAGLMGAAVTYACLVLASVVLHAFVVYGRTARQLVPFLCLVAGAGFTALAASPRRSVRRLAAVAALLAVAQAAANFRQPLMQWFPREFIVRNMPAADRLAQSARVIWINTRHLRPLPGADAGLPANAVTIAEASHPLQFRPYQYEGYTPAERAVLRSTDISMRLVGVPAEP